MFRRRFFALALTVFASMVLLQLPDGVAAQTYPAKPVRLLSSAPPGGGGDSVLRPIAQELSERLGQQVVVDNRPGAGGIIAAQAAAKAPPDGYTLFGSSASTFSIAPYLQKKPPYDASDDFTPITLYAVSPLLLAVHPSLPVETTAGLIQFAKRHPGELLYASNGRGSLSHLTMAMFSRAAGIRLAHVPYKGGAPAVLATVSGEAQLIVTALPTLIGQVNASRLRALAVSSARRSPALPDLPTIAESGVPGFESVQWYGLFGPRGLPPAIVERVVDAMRATMDSPHVRLPLALEGAEISVSGPNVLAELLRASTDKWRRVIRESGAGEN